MERHSSPAASSTGFAALFPLSGRPVPTFFLGLLLVFVFYYLLDWAPAPLGRLGIVYSTPTDVTGFWIIDSLIGGDVDAFSACSIS